MHPLVYPLVEDLDTSKEGSTKHAHYRVKQRCRAMYLSIRSFGDNEGPFETARLSSELTESEDCMIDLVIRELHQYNVQSCRSPRDIHVVVGKLFIMLEWC